MLTVRQFNSLSFVCLIAGFVSIIASIAIWFLNRDGDPAHAERFGIFVGLWAPTFFILANRFERPLAIPRSTMTVKSKHDID